MPGFRKPVRAEIVHIVANGVGERVEAVVVALRTASPRTFAMRMHSALDDVTRWLPEEHAKRTGATLDRTVMARSLLQASGQGGAA